MFLQSLLEVSIGRNTDPSNKELVDGTLLKYL